MVFTMENREEWREVPQCDNYEVSNFGRVRHAEKGTIKGAPVAKNGYRVVNLWRRGIGRVYTVHSLVAEAFVGARPSGWSVNHIDGDKMNNSPENLEYLTLADNSRHQAAIGLGQRGESNGRAKLTEEQVRDIRRRAAEGEQTVRLAEEFGVGCPIISQIKHGTRWRHVR